MKISKHMTMITTIFIFSFSSVQAIASGDHEHNDKGHASHGKSSGHNDEHSHGGMGHDSSKMFLKEKKIDGYTVSFHVMQAKKGMEHDGSHNFMVKVEKNGEIQKNVVINSKVVHPNNQAESKMLTKMGDWYMGGYDLGHKGKHQLMILFKTSDGKKHKGGVYYSG